MYSFLCRRFKKYVKSPDPLEEQLMKEQGSMRGRGIFGWAETGFAANANLRLLRILKSRWCDPLCSISYLVYLPSGDSWQCSTMVVELRKCYLPLHCLQPLVHCRVNSQTSGHILILHPCKVCRSSSLSSLHHKVWSIDSSSVSYQKLPYVIVI